MEWKRDRFFCPAHFKLILHSIRNLCKFAEPFAIQYAAIITDGYSSDCFQLIFFPHPTWICQSGRTNIAPDWVYHIRFILHYICCIRTSLRMEWWWDTVFARSKSQASNEISNWFLFFERIPIKDKQNYFTNSDGINFFYSNFRRQSVARDVCHWNGIGYIEIESKHKQWITFWRRKEKCEIKRSQVSRAQSSKEVERKFKEQFEEAMLQKVAT